MVWDLHVATSNSLLSSKDKNQLLHTIPRIEAAFNAVAITITYTTTIAFSTN
jgi:hypothetical protein